MSSVQDRIRRLQSADASPQPDAPAENAAQHAAQQPPAPSSVSALASHFASAKIPPAPPAASVAARAAVVEHSAAHRRPPALDKRAAAFAADKADPAGGNLAARITQLEAGVEQDTIAKQVRRLENVAQVSKLGVRHGGSDAVAGVRSQFEREQEAAAGSGAVLLRAGAFAQHAKSAEVGPEGVEGEAGATGLLNRAAAFEQSAGGDGKDGDGKSALHGRAAVFENAQGRGGDGEDEVDVSAVQGRAALFEREAASSAGSVMGRATAFEKQKDEADARGVLGRAGIFERDEEQQKEGRLSAQAHPAADNKLHNVRQAGSVSSRFAMFDAQNKQENVQQELKTAPKSQVLRKTHEEPNVAETPTPLSPIEELHQVKALNKELVTRLVQLTDAFKKLEKSREELQTRIANLENK